LDTRRANLHKFIFRRIAGGTANKSKFPPPGRPALKILEEKIRAPKAGTPA
jgi:hypothetical protein